MGGVYIKHPSIANEKKIEIGKCKGENPSEWYTCFAKHVLEEFKLLGFKSWEGDKYGDQKALDFFINNYQHINTNCTLFKDLKIINTRPKDKAKLKEIANDWILLLPNGGKTSKIVTDALFLDSIMSLAARHEIDIQISDYKYNSIC